MNEHSTTFRPLSAIVNSNNNCEKMMRRGERMLDYGHTGRTEKITDLLAFWLPQTQKMQDMAYYDELVVYTQYDGRDLRSVEEIRYYDADGEERPFERATAACIEITTCADQGDDLWSWLGDQIKAHLNAIGIQFGDLDFQE
ncbi:MAG TPA: hypothetical protein VF534_06805 [Paraburkholderia sp.]